MDEQHATLEQLLRDTTAYRRSLRDVQELLNHGVPSPRVVQDVSTRFRAPNPQLYFQPGETVPFTGIYRVFHLHNCSLVPKKCYAKEGQHFPRCTDCGEQAYYRLFKHCG